MPYLLAIPAPPPLVEVTASTLEQVVAVVTAYGVKPAYMILTVLVWRWLRGQAARDMVLIRQSMVAFLVGETACALQFADLWPLACDALETIHGLGMVVMGGLLAYGAAEFLDKRVLSTSDVGRPCAFLRACTGCWKHSQAWCPLFRLVKLSVPMAIVVALLPLSAPLSPHRVRYQVFGTAVLDETTVFIAVLEGRVFPVLAIVLFALSWWRMRGGPTSMDRAKGAYFLGLGALAYALFKTFLRGSFGAGVFWGNAWEEVTEFLTLVMTLYFLRQYRHLWQKPAKVVPHA